MPNPRNCQGRTDTGHRIARTDDDPSRGANSLEHTGRRTALCDAGIENLFNVRLPAPFDEIFLKGNFTFRSLNSRLDAIVRHGKNPGFDAETVPKPVRDIGQFETRAQEACSRNVCSDISVAEFEPGLAAEFFQLLQDRESVVLDSPPFCTVTHTGERI